MGASAIRILALLGLVGLELLWLGHPDLSWWLRAWQLTFIAATIWRPTVGVVALACLAPVSTTLAALAASPYRGGRHVEVMVLAVVMAAVWHWRSDAPTRTGRAALVVGIIALASAASVYPTRLLTLGPEPFTLVRSPFWDPLFFGRLIAAGAALAWAVERLTRARPLMAPSTVGALLAGHAAASVLTIRELMEPASRSTDAVATFIELFLSVRTHTQYDVNAAAATLVLVVLASIGLWTVRRAAIVAPAVLLSIAGLWLTGSRIALAAGIVAGAVTAAVRLAQRGVARRTIVAASVILVAIVAALAVTYPVGRNLPVSTSVQSRLVLMETGLKMAADAPLTGVGVGRFVELSEQYGSAAIQPMLGSLRTRDNAHNYFIQVLAEMGALGMVAFCWLLATAVGPPRRWRTLDPPAQWLLCGVLGSMATWLTGHPLLVPHAAYVFWLAAGLFAGLSTPHTPSRRDQALTGIACIAILSSVPWQSAGHRDREVLENLGRDVSVWQEPLDGERYRVAGPNASVFVPTGHEVELPLRLARGQGSASVRITVIVDGATVNELEVDGEQWTPLHLSLRPARRQFVEVRFGAPAGSVLRIGRAVARPVH